MTKEQTTEFVSVINEKLFKGIIIKYKGNQLLDIRYIHINRRIHHKWKINYIDIVKTDNGEIFKDISTELINDIDVNDFTYYTLQKVN